MPDQLWDLARRSRHGRGFGQHLCAIQQLRYVAAAHQLVLVAIARTRATTSASHSFRPVLTRSQEDATCCGKFAKASGESPKKVFFLPACAPAVHLEHVCSRQMYTAWFDRPCNTLGRHHLECEAIAVQAGQRICRPGTENSGAQAKIGGHSTNARASSASMGFSPAALRALLMSTAFWKGLGGIIQLLPCGGIAPAAIFVIMSWT